jgi:hypothetical protein
MRAAAEGPAKPLASPQLIDPFNHNLSVQAPTLSYEVSVHLTCRRDGESRVIGKKGKHSTGPIRVAGPSAAARKSASLRSG